jgi:hypothetical protein
MRLSWVVLAGLSLIGIAGCKFDVKAKVHSPAEQRQAAIEALERLHERFNAREFELIHAEAHESLRALPDGKSQFLTNFKDSHERFGKVIRADVLAASCLLGEVHLLVQAQYEKGDVGEIFIWNVSGAEPRLQYIQIIPGKMPPPEHNPNECPTT